MASTIPHSFYRVFDRVERNFAIPVDEHFTTTDSQDAYVTVASTVTHTFYLVVDGVEQNFAILVDEHLTTNNSQHAYINPFTAVVSLENDH